MGWLRCVLFGSARIAGSRTAASGIRRRVFNADVSSRRCIRANASPVDRSAHRSAGRGNGWTCVWSGRCCVFTGPWTFRGRCRLGYRSLALGPRARPSRMRLQLERQQTVSVVRLRPTRVVSTLIPLLAAGVFFLLVLRKEDKYSLGALSASASQAAVGIGTLLTAALFTDLTLRDFCLVRCRRRTLSICLPFGLDRPLARQFRFRLDDFPDIEVRFHEAGRPMHDRVVVTVSNSNVTLQSFVVVSSWLDADTMSRVLAGAWRPGGLAIG